ncbi:helix-turn-helix domain-containing protein [Nitratireductor soli]|uniref:helix-turn-helix domain-containing protein n=1 Tax=Nitratireductor soli TaxID=1670619 RepID=UPI0012F8B47B|nr:helix-turn-helix transcriptional regulator [Nitratireductor soli]
MSWKKDEESRLERMRERLRGTIESSGGIKSIAALSDVPANTLGNYVRGVVKEPPVSILVRIAETCGISPVWLMGLDEEPADLGGFSENDAEVYDGLPPSTPAKPPIGNGCWQVTSRALELSAIIPGDVIEFTIGANPRKGEVVVAQLYSRDGRSARTVLRLFNPPFLMVHTNDPAIDIAPIPIDPNGERVKVMGAFVRLVREPRR